MALSLYAAVLDAGDAAARRAADREPLPPPSAAGILQNGARRGKLGTLEAGPQLTVWAGFSEMLGSTRARYNGLWRRAMTCSRSFRPGAVELLLAAPGNARRRRVSTTWRAGAQRGGDIARHVGQQPRGER